MPRMAKLFWFIFIITFSHSVLLGAVYAQVLNKPSKKPEWFENIVAEFHGYHWFTDGNITHRHFWGTGPYDFSHLKYDTDSNLYIIGGEAGYKFSLPLLERITAGFETSQGSSDSMHGTDSDPGLPSFQRHSGKDSAKYISAALYIRPVEGEIIHNVKGYFDIFGEWIRYKDRVTITQFVDVVPGTSGTFAGAPNPFKIRHEGAGIGFRGGLGFFDMFKLEGRFAYYPDMSVKRTLYWDVPINRKFVFFGEDETGFTARITLGFTPLVKPFKERKNLEFEFGYQYMQFEQNGGRGRRFTFSDGTSGNINNWERARSWRDGFFIGGTIRW